ncbi:peptide-methionine (S)-S-oxide reductase MsrA [Haploplasma axanthum]|uniref:Peptide methionine sulfoxide reductase MsrA n=1 Tax=Haploplasma axanthum TaxID=29552 RepID=A0A449BFK0_HAPAX|nr:peptide-methionine (S)-S-oxide reductase MsrA [Haploplasma axanthum]VEU81229.1 peptide-methionine (S)-S-oxide reductase [Haploplasma axanthum]
MEKEIVFAGGCFWGVDAYFKDVLGVIETKTGYANGNTKNPTYEDVCAGIATHAEVVYIKYDGNKTNLNILLDHFFRIVNPYTLNKQGNDIGIQYRSGIYYSNLDDKKIVADYINKLQAKSDRKIVVAVEELRNFYEAEEYHQDYLTKNPKGYCHIDLGLLKEEEKNPGK